jgi:hypothetical protein
MMKWSCLFILVLASSLAMSAAVAKKIGLETNTEVELYATTVFRKIS